MKFNKIVEAIKMVLEVLIGLHWLWNKPNNDDNTTDGTNVPEEDNKPTEAK